MAGVQSLGTVFLYMPVITKHLECEYSTLGNIRILQHRAILALRQVLVKEIQNEPV